MMKASFGEADMPVSLRRHLNMALPSLFPRGLFLVASLFVFYLGNSLPAPAQDTGPITSGSSNYQKAPVSTILDLYEQLSGKHLIRDASLDNVPPVSINATGLSKMEMIKLIEETLLLNGVTIIPVDEHNLKVVAVGINKNPRSEGVKLYANAADLPITDEVVSYYMPLNYINPQEAAGIFTQVAPPHTGYGFYMPAPSAQAVVLTENVSVIRQLIALKDLIDAPPARVVSEWVQLNRADAEKVADILNKMLGLGPNGVPTAPAGPGGAVFVPASLGNGGPLSNEHNLISGAAQILPDPRSNRLLIITRPVNLPFLEQMIGQLDMPDIFMVPQRRPLKYVLAQDILPALEAALAQGKDEEDQLKKDQSAAQAKTPNQPQGSNAAPTSAAGASSGGTGSVAALTPQLATPTENNVPTVVTIGKTRLLADNRSNSIIVFGSPDVVSRVFYMIDELDRKPLQVYLATVIGDLTVSEGEEFGIDILQKFQRIGQGGLASSNLNSSQAGSTTPAASTFFPEPSSLTSAMGFPLPTGLTLYGAIGSTLNAYVRALETTDRFKIISRPSVYTTNNKLAVIASGQQVPVPSSTTSGFTGSTTANGLTTTSSIAYEDVLLQLDIIPLINANREVTLKIRQTNNSLGANVNISGNFVPIITTQEINTEVTVPDKSTIVIGGLIKDIPTRDTSGVPWLSDIPILGYLFKDTKKTKERDELIIMIQPSVIETDADQIEVNEAEKQRTILGREAVEAATGVTAPVALPVVLPVAPLTLAPQTEVKSVTIRSSGYNSKTGAPAKTTTTTTTTVTEKLVPTAETPSGPIPTGLVPALSSPAPDVSNGQMPKYPPSGKPPTTSP
jgi:general secretion pathway protein D